MLSIYARPLISGIFSFRDTTIGWRSLVSRSLICTFPSHPSALSLSSLSEDYYAPLSHDPPLPLPSPAYRFLLYPVAMSSQLVFCAYIALLPPER